MSCLLCLEAFLEGTTGVQLNTNNADHNSSIKHIIEQHFLWLKLDAMENENSAICQLCYQALLVFHKFYERIEQAHKILEKQDIKPLETYDFVEPTSAVAFAEVKLDEMEAILESNKPIKTEPEFGIDEPMVKPKRGRGRPRRHPVPESSPVLSARETRASRKRGVSAGPDESAIDELYVPVIKTEALEVIEGLNAIDALHDIGVFDADDSISDNASTVKFMSAPRKHHATATKRAKLIKRPREVSGKAQISQENDKYIADHFNLSCCLCNAPLENFTVLKAHFRNEHQMRGYVLCCNKKLLKRGVLVDHLRTHQDPTYFKCTRCDKVLATRRCLELHMERHEQSRERKFQCEVCSKRFYLHAVYTRHKLLHLPAEQKIIPCPQCEKTFATNYIMKQHLKLVHLNAYGKICDICGKSLIGRAALRRHLEEHSGVAQPPIQCDLCGITLTSKYGLTRHMKAIHMEENRVPQVCPICSKVSPGQKAHERHMQYMHTMERKHACPMCVKAFKRPKELREHMTTHTGEVLYTCPHCPKTFNSNANMHSHRKKVHRKEWEERRLQRFNKAPHKIDMTDGNETLPMNNVLELIPQNA